MILAVQREDNRALAAALRPTGLTPSQAEVLDVLDLLGPLSVGQLGAHLVTETGSPSRLASGLVRRGLAERSREGDRRKAILTLTPAGRTALDEVHRLEAALHERTAELISGSEMERLLGKLWLLVEDRPAGRAVVQQIARSLSANPSA